MSEQKSSKRPPFPLVLTGNDLIGGHPVWFSGTGWSADPKRALVASDAGAAERLDQVLEASQQDIVEPYLVTVALDASGAPVPAHYREKIRAIGPTYALEAAL